MNRSELYEALEALAAQAEEVRDLATENKPTATKNAAAGLHETIVDLLKRVEALEDNDLE